MHTLLVGLDAFDPVVFERLYNQGRMPHLGKYVQTGGYSRFSISNPAQSEVSWTSIATGANPGSHGLFDFVHRDPETYDLSVSLLPTKTDLLGVQFIPPHQANTIFDQAARMGYPATSLWWPATFPARLESPVRTLPGLGTPDILGFLGVGTLFTTDAALADEDFKTRIEPLQPVGKGRFSGFLKGPNKKKGAQIQESVLEFSLDLEEGAAGRMKLGRYDLELREGKWSPILEISFKLGLLVQVQAITRVIITRLLPTPRIYFLPLQIHPLASPWRYASPPGFIKQAWKECGPFLTLGWPQDTTALDEKWIDDDQFFDLCDSIVESRERVLMHNLQAFNEGLLAVVFDTLDRVQHMFWRDREDIIEAWYQRLDSLVGRIEEAAGRPGKDSLRLLVISDHGFSRYDYKVHLNRWLQERGYLAASDNGPMGKLKQVDWSQSQAYAVGLNSLYLNLAGREGKGCVQPSKVEDVKEKLRQDLLEWRGPDGRPVVRQVYAGNDVLEGPLSQHGPDLLVGYNSGYRASSETGLGGWKQNSIEENKDHWGADHCIDPEAVPGVLFSNHSLENFPNVSYRDIPALSIDMALDSSGGASPRRQNSPEDQEVIEERLKGLGYL